jgi:hypothetical protein
MRKVFLYAIFLLIIQFQTISVSGQEQDAVSRKIADKFNKYCSIYPREEIYVHTDREQYIAGEDVWFRVYAVDRKSGTRSSLSSIAYFEILNGDNRPVIRKRILLADGSGPGHIILPDTLRTGTYILRTYTNWMKNFLPGNCFVKEFEIINALEPGSGIRNILPDKTKVTATQARDAVLRIDKSNTENITISVTATPEFLQKNGKMCRIFIHTNGLINLTEIYILDGEQTSRTYSREKFSAGINHITLFDVKGNPVDEKFIYTPQEKSEVFKLNVSSSFGYREKLSLGLDTQTTGLQDLSISIAPVIPGKRFLSMTDYMAFGSEFGNELINQLVESYTGNLSENTVDSLLLQAKSSWIDWNMVLGDVQQSIKYEPEKRYHYLTGSLISTNPKDSVSGKFILMSIPGKSAGFQYAITDRNGNFSFTLPIDQQQKQIIIQPKDPDENRSIKIQSSFFEEYAPSLNYSDSVSAIPAGITKLGTNYQVNKIYGVAAFKPAVLTMPAEKIKRFYGKPDNGLVMDDYIKLPVMEEVFFELLPGTFLRKKKSVYDITVLDPVTNDIYKEPHLFIDGVRIDDANIIAALDPETVERIDVVRSRYMVGDYLFRGIVNVITRAGDFSGVNLPDYAVNTFYRVIDPVENFSMPDYSDNVLRQSRIPDFRNTLYWNPKVSKALDFWTSDFSSDYRILIEGMSSDGKFISIEKTIRIK